MHKNLLETLCKMPIDKEKKVWYTKYRTTERTKTKWEVHLYADLS